MSLQLYKYYNNVLEWKFAFVSKDRDWSAQIQKQMQAVNVDILFISPICLQNKLHLSQVVLNGGNFETFLQTRVCK